MMILIMNYPKTNYTFSKALLNCSAQPVKIGAHPCSFHLKLNYGGIQNG